MNEFQTGDTIKIYPNTDVKVYKRMINDAGFYARREGNLIIVGEPFVKVPSYARQIRTARRNKNMTREQLAEKMGVSTYAVYDWEVGRHNPKDWRKLQKILGISL